MIHPLNLFAALVVGHALADYPLQGEFLAKAKNRFAPLPGAPWEQALGVHALIHGGMVWVLTGQLWLGALEAVFHAWIDDTKCAGGLTFRQDQALHVFCKLLWTMLAVLTVGVR